MKASEIAATIATESKSVPTYMRHCFAHVPGGPSLPKTTLDDHALQQGHLAPGHISVTRIGVTGGREGKGRASKTL